MKSVLLGILGLASLAAAGGGFASTAEETYKRACAVCHDSGVANAPRLGDKTAWAPRVSEGKEALYKSGLEGKAGTAMVPKGGFTNLSDDEVKAVVDLMIAKAK